MNKHVANDHRMCRNACKHLEVRQLVLIPIHDSPSIYETQSKQEANHKWTVSLNENMHTIILATLKHQQKSGGPNVWGGIKFQRFLHPLLLSIVTCNAQDHLLVPYATLNPIVPILKQSFGASLYRLWIAFSPLVRPLFPFAIFPRPQVSPRS